MFKLHLARKREIDLVLLLLSREGARSWKEKRTNVPKKRAQSCCRQVYIGRIDAADAAAAALPAT